MLRRSALALVLALAACSGGNSSGKDPDGGSGIDAEPQQPAIDASIGPRIDAGEGDIDAGEGDIDAGEGDIDAGEGDIDAGEGDIDAGEGGIDAGEPEPDAGPFVPGSCNPVTQTGCGAGEKCAWVTVSEEPLLGQTTCVPAGTVAIDGACTEGVPGPDTGYDDCAAGGQCQGGTCHAICTGEPDSCTDDRICQPYFGLFDDLGDDASVGLCGPTCEPVGQDLAGWDDCADDEGCYLHATSGKGVCARVPEDAIGLGQGDLCYGPAAGSCFLNGCDRGYQSILFAAPGGPDVACSAFCTPADSYLGHAGAAVGTGAARCTEARIGVAGQACRFLQSVYDSDVFDGSVIPATYGTCAPTAVWGSCAAYNPVGMADAYNAGYVGVDQAAKEEAAAAALCTYCGLSSDCATGEMLPRCQNTGCVSIAKDAEFDALYTTGP